MSIRFASAISAVALAAGLSAPAFAGEAENTEVIIITATEQVAAPVRAIEPVDFDTASHQGDDASPFTVSGAATLTSDYRFRGVSQSDEGIAAQAGFTVSHESGLYAGAWGSNLAGWGTFGGSNTELDLYGGFKFPVGEGTLDTGLVWYMYPSGADTTDFAEVYAKLSGSVGGLGLTAGVAYAPKQEALGNANPIGAPANPGDKESNLYLSGDAVYGIADTPVSLKAHIGYSDGNPGLGPNGTSIAPTGTYFDWLLGVDVVALPGLTLSAAYVDTDITSAEAALLGTGFTSSEGDEISDATVVFSVTASF